MMPLPLLTIADGLLEATHHHPTTAAVARTNFADTLAAVPLFSTWTGTTTTPSASPATPASGGISTQATSNRRHDGRRRSHS